MANPTYTFFVDWNNDGDYSDTGETITSRVLGTGAISTSYGRDQARSLSAVAPGEMQLEINNSSGDYSPDNTGSPLAGNVTPGKPILFQALHNAVTYTMFRGYLDGFDLKPGGGHDINKVAFQCSDLLSRVGQAELSTQLYETVQTGEAIGILLDEIGWPTASRDIDPGATTIRWFWEDGTSGLEALKKIIESEGPPAIAFVDASGNFVFRDRHHRMIRSASSTVQATFRSTGTEPTFHDIDYDIGWKDLVNQITVDVEEREPIAFGEVWSTEDIITLAAGESRILEAKAGDPYFGALAPVSGTDYVLVSGAVDVILSRDSGQSCKVTITASSAAVIQGMAFRAYSVPVARSYHIVVEDTASITSYGVRTIQDADMSWAGRHDAFAIAHVILGQRAERRPVVSITLKNANDTRITQMLSRNLSDLIHIIEATDTYIDDDYFIERIEHEWNQAGKDWATTFHCEKAYKDTTSTPTYFRFDTAGAGFNDGVFNDAGVMTGTQVFILDDATYGVLDTGALGF